MAPRRPIRSVRDMQGYSAAIFACLLVHPLLHALAADPTEAPTEAPPKTTTVDPNAGKVEIYNQSYPYCFHMTWLGEEYDKDIQINPNTTCKAILDGYENSPCRQPLVITNNAKYPDMDYLWNNYKMRVACRQTKGQVCAKYTYMFNGAVLNATFFCTKVVDVNEGAITRGCYTQTVGGISSELCVCKSEEGSKPCNSAFTSKIHLWIIGIALIVVTWRN